METGKVDVAQPLPGIAVDLVDVLFDVDEAPARFLVDPGLRVDCLSCTAVTLEVVDFGLRVDCSSCTAPIGGW